MSELVWGIKNGDLEQVRDIVENKANTTRMLILKVASEGGENTRRDRGSVCPKCVLLPFGLLST